MKKRRKSGERTRRVQTSRRDAGVWIGWVPWTYVHGYLREVAPRPRECRWSYDRKIRVEQGILRLWRPAVATPMGGRPVPLRYPAFPRSQIPDARPSPGYLSNYIRLNQTIEIMKAAPKAKIGRLSGLNVAVGKDMLWECAGMTALWNSMTCRRIPKSWRPYLADRMESTALHHLLAGGNGLNFSHE